MHSEREMAMCWSRWLAQAGWGRRPNQGTTVVRKREGARVQMTRWATQSKTLLARVGAIGRGGRGGRSGKLRRRGGRRK